MRRIFAFLLVCLLVGAMLVPTVCAVLPADGRLVAAHTAIAASVGQDTVGAAVLVIEGGGAAMAEGFGYADLATGVLVTPDTVFEIGEISALFVTLSVLRLIDEGVISLDDNVADCLSQDVVASLALQYPVTIRQLLAGQGGFGGRITDVFYEKKEHCFESLTEAVLAAVPEQVTKPGTVTSYSDFGIALLALVVEWKTGKPFSLYVTDQFLAPLAMQDTQLSLQLAVNAPATGYTQGEDGAFYTDSNNGRRYAALAPATGAVTSLSDMQKLLLWLLSENALSAASRAILKQTVASGMLTVGATPFTPLSNGVLALSGSTACFGAALTLDLDAENAALVLVNTPVTALLSLPSALFGGVGLSLTLPQGDMAELKPLRGTYLPMSADLSCFVGRLAAMDVGALVRVKDDTLYFGDAMLVQIARGVFADATAPEVPLLQFLLDEEGEPVALLTADGAVYTPAPVFGTGLPARAALGALFVLGAGVLLLALFGLFRWLTDLDRHGRREGVLSPLAGGFAALTVLFAGTQVLLAFKRGAMAISSAYFALRVLTLLAGIAAAVTLVLAFITTVFNRRTHRHVATAGIAFVLFFLLAIFFGLTVM